MGFFSSLSGAVSEYMPYVKTAASIYGTVSSMGANRSATGQAQSGVRRANQLSQEQYGMVRDATAGSIEHQRAMAAGDPYQLTSEQQRSLDEVRGSARRAVTGGALAGSGRAQVAAFNEMEGTARDRMTSQNIQRQDTASGNLSRIGMRAGLESGRVAGAAAMDSANLGAQNTLANAGLRGRALGDILSLVSQDDKEKATGVKQTIGTEQV